MARSKGSGLISWSSFIINGVWYLSLSLSSKRRHKWLAGACLSGQLGFLPPKIHRVHRGTFINKVVLAFSACTRTSLELIANYPLSYPMKANHITKNKGAHDYQTAWFFFWSSFLKVLFIHYSFTVFSRAPLVIFEHMPLLKVTAPGLVVVSVEKN